MPLELTDAADPLNIPPQRRIFVEEYMLDFNARQAAIRAGYNAGYEGYLLKDPAVRAAIEFLMDQRLEAYGLHRGRVLEELLNIGLADIRDVVTWGEGGVVHWKSAAEMSPAAARSIAQISIKRSRRVRGKDGEHEWEVEDITFKQHDKLGALRLLMMHLNLLPQANNQVGVNVNVNNNERLPLAVVDAILQEARATRKGGADRAKVVN